jgi:hypothetical protein
MQCQHCGRSLPDEKAGCPSCRQEENRASPTAPDEVSAHSASSLTELPPMETSVAVGKPPAPKPDTAPDEPPTLIRVKGWVPRRERVEAWGVRKELNHYEVLDLGGNEPDELVAQRISLLERSLNKWASDPMQYELQKIGSSGQVRIYDLKQALRDRPAYDALLQQEKHLAALKRVHEAITQCVKDDILQWNEWKFILLPKAEEEGVGRQELEAILREMKARGVLTGLELAGSEVRTILELKDVCQGKGQALVEVIWNSKLEAWLARAALRRDLADEARLVKEEYKDNRESGAQRMLWRMNEKVFILAGPGGEVKIESVKDWVEGVYTRGLESASITALEDRRLEDWLLIAMNRERLSRLAASQRGNGRRGLWEVIWQTNQRSEETEKAYKRTKTLIKEYPDFLEAQYQHAAHCALTNRPSEMRVLLQKLIETDSAYGVRARSDAGFQNAGNEIQNLLKGLTANRKPLKFPRGLIYTVNDLIARCEEDVENAQEYLFNGYIETWLGKDEGEAPLAALAKNTAKQYVNLKRRGLEMFVRGLCREANIEPYPKLSAQPDVLNLGTLPQGAQTSAGIRLKNLSRGYAWGAVIVEPALPGLKVSPSFDGVDSALSLSLDTLRVEPGPYSGKIIIRPEGVPEQVDIPLSYVVAPLRVDIKPPALELGKVLHGTRSVAPVTISCQQGGRLVGAPRALEPNLNGVTVTGGLDGAANELFIAVDTTALPPGKIFDSTLKLATNAGELQIPIKFKTSLRWKHLVIIRTAGYGLLVGVAMFLLRALLENFEGLEDWFLYYDNSAGTIISAGAVGALAVALLFTAFRRSRFVKALIPQRLKRPFIARSRGGAVEMDDALRSIGQDADHRREKV